MQISPLLSLLQLPLPPLHADGLGGDELLPAGLAVLIGIGVYSVITGGSSGGKEKDGSRPRRGGRRDRQ